MAEGLAEPIMSDKNKETFLFVVGFGIGAVGMAFLILAIDNVVIIKHPKNLREPVVEYKDRLYRLVEVEPDK